MGVSRAECERGVRSASGQCGVRVGSAEYQMLSDVFSYQMFLHLMFILILLKLQ